MATITGSPGNDVLSGTSDNDSISGGAGNDQISGGAGNDFLSGDAGDDFLDGGAGFDWAVISTRTGNITVNLVTGTASSAESGNDTLQNIESVLVSGLGAATITGDDNDNFIHVSASGPNSVSAAGGDDVVADWGRGSTLDGGTGRNQVALFRSEQFNGFTTIAATAPFTHTFTPGVSGTLADGTSYSNFDFYDLHTGSGDDNVTFNQLKKRASDSLTNQWDGGGGNDTVTVDLSGYSTPLLMYQETSGAASISDNGPPGTTSILFLSHVENYRIIGGSGDDTFGGGAGSDIFTGNGGKDTLEGGEGADLARYSGLSSDYRIDDLSNNVFKVTDLRGGAPDGTDTLTNIERLQWGDGSVTVLYDSPPTLVTRDTVKVPGQSLALSSLLSVSDVDGNAITRYQLWDATRDAGSGYFVVNGIVQNPGTAIDLAASQLGQAFFVTGAVADSLQIRAYDGSRWSAADNAAWAPFTVKVDNPPVVTAHDMHTAAHQLLAAAGLVSNTDADGDSRVRFQLWDSTGDPNSGHFIVNGVAQLASTIIDLTPDEFFTADFVTGTVDDSLQIRAFDGTFWSAADDAPWSPFLIGPTVNRAPQLYYPAAINPQHHQSIAVSGMFTIVDQDGDAMTRYQLWDSTRDPDSGYFVVNGQVQAAGTLIDITAAQMTQTSFVAGMIDDNIQIRAFDGQAWSAPDRDPWAPVTVNVPANHAPIMTVNNVMGTRFQTLALSSLFQVSDADGDGIVKYQLWDSTRDPNSGHFAIGGAPLGAGTVIDITAAQLAQTTFVTGLVSDGLQIRAFDGFSWSAAENASWSPFTISTNNAPVVTTGTANAQHGRSLALSSLFQINDADGDTITKYQLWDSTRDPNSGHFMIGGTAQAASTVIEITAAQLAQTSFVTGAVSDSLQIRAFDGIDWSAGDNAPWSPFTVSVTPYTAPSLTTQDVNTTAGQSLSLSSLFQVSDVDGDSMTRYQLWDSIRDPNSGSFVVGGVAKAPGTVIDITAADLAQTSFLTGTVGDSLQIRAFDGFSWSASDAASWAPFHINVS
jgi:hypothetical protein